MCLKQRHTYYAIILLISFFYLFQKLKKFWLNIFIEVSILYGIFYAIWHVGVEQKILQGPSSCYGTLSPTNSIEKLKEQIINQSLVNCAEIDWLILGFSAASINSVLLLFILIFNSIYILKNYYHEKKIY